MSELPPDLPEVIETGAPVGALDGSMEETGFDAPVGSGDIDNDETLAATDADSGFGELVADTDDLAEVIDLHQDDSDLFGDAPDAEILRPTFNGSRSAAPDTDAHGLESGQEATIRDLHDEAEPEARVPEVIDCSADTPQGGKIYPADLLAVADQLMGEGETGEIEAMRLLDEYDKSPDKLEIPRQPESSEDDDPPEDYPGQDPLY